ncbi:hypothetical protein CGLO_01248 [Colletotrichum gloeosporioides Cg-14]|uniref:Uncharacterized protein n=1 Tax=Colletotrichum gloeosporioides (strain Cg-14) TaxID=1237896 RepID=T0L0W7_COLGC|nr:hypothetical protein CGLO_01248 [Colletotrichum gloeosporioides Cg-14]
MALTLCLPQSASHAQARDLCYTS